MRELKSKSEAELKDFFLENTQKLRDLNFKLASDQLKNVRDVRKVKKIIAQIHTLMQERKGKKEITKK